MRYRDAGVDVARADAVKHDIGAAVRATWGAGVRPIPGGFAGVIAVPGAGEHAPLLAATMDSVGTKLHLALAAGRVGDAARDLVYHCANDLLAHGARPLALLDYVAQSRLDPDTVRAVVDGLSRGCVEVGAALLGGETAELPDTYLPGVVDVAGCMIGTVAAAELMDGSAVRAGDCLLGLAAEGLHTNGYSLARRVLERSGLAGSAALPGGDGESVVEALLRPHRWYGPSLLPLVGTPGLHALAHVTGGGIAGNLIRVLPQGCRARVLANALPRPPVFQWLIQAGEVPEEDARQALNLGIGMIAVCARDQTSALAGRLERAGEQVRELGDVVAGKRAVEWVEDSS
jgi:phosphoribosylformylglycinamidine cyclo-ligase